MSLFTEKIYVEIFPSRQNIYDYSTKREIYDGFRKAKREVLKFLSENQNYSVANFYTEKGEFLKEIGL